MDELLLDAQTLGLPIDNATQLAEKYQYLTAALSARDSAAVCDHAKTLLESIFRTIINNRNGAIDETPDNRPSFVELYRQTCSALSPHDTDESFLPIIKKCITVIADMRDNYGASSHGQDGYEDRTVRIEEATFIARTALAISGYLYARHVNTGSDHKNVRLHYDDNSSFNDYLDSEGDVEVIGIFVAPSRILFDNDPIAYREKLLEYTNDIYILEK